MGNCFGPSAAQQSSSPASEKYKEKPAAKAKTLEEAPLVSTGDVNALYTFGKELGQGAYSVVYKATEKSSKKTVAIKKIRKSSLQPHDHAALKEEVRCLKLCRHPHILEFEGFFDEERYYYVVTEVVEGGELFDRICEKTVYDEHDARELVKTLLSTLAFMHGHNIVHRDLKPENLLLKGESDSDIKLADFGFATVAQGKTLNQLCGTPDYVAPEIVDKQLHPYGLSCDVWSAGVITYILLGGYPPFQAKNDDREELFKVIKKGKFKFHDEYWSDISKDARDMIKKMLTLDQDKRPTAAELLKHKWIGLSEAELRKINLGGAKDRLQEFNAKRKLKAAAKTVMAVNKMQKAVMAFK